MSDKSVVSLTTRDDYS